jgi:hypothetical protein
MSHSIGGASRPMAACVSVGSDRLSHTDDLDFELWNSEPSHFDQFVRGLECIQNGR